jgi:ribosome-associated heat shock protein Hsp15
VPSELDATRIDRWLVAVRLFKTRAAAGEACTGSHVRINGSIAKPSAQVKVGDRVDAFVAKRLWIVEVTKVIDKRVGAPAARECYLDNSPPIEKLERVPPTAVREAGAGRPTKRDRRKIDKWRQR